MRLFQNVATPEIDLFASRTAHVASGYVSIRFGDSGSGNITTPSVTVASTSVAVPAAESPSPDPQPPETKPAMCVIEEDFLFLGSRLGNSLLLRVTERENRMLFSVEKPLEATVDLTVSDAEKEKEKEKEKDASANKEVQQKEDPAAKKRRMDTISDCVASDVIEISDKDELEVYGSDIRTSTQLTSYVFEVCDSLLNICPIGDVSMGEPQLQAGGRDPSEHMELVACSGRGKNGALCVLQRALRPHTLTAFSLPGCIDMWTVMGDPGSTEAPREAHKDADGSHAYLILTQEDSSMILQTGEEINEVDSSGFMTGASTVLAANLGNNKYMVQVTTTAIRLLTNGVQIQSMQLEWTAASAAVADPYLCVVSVCGRALVLALREFRGKDGALTARLAPTRQAVPQRPALARAVPYRDLSGLLAPPDPTPTQVKGEFQGKTKNVKAEGLKPGAIYELNDDDELLYGGDQTPASMASIMLAEQSKNPGVPRRMSRWWRRHLVEVKPTYWLFVVRTNGNLELYSLPEMRLSFLVRDACGGHRPINAHTAGAQALPMDGIGRLGHEPPRAWIGIAKAKSLPKQGGYNITDVTLPTKNPTVLPRLPERVSWDPGDSPRYLFLLLLAVRGMGGAPRHPPSTGPATERAGPGVPLAGPLYIYHHHHQPLNIPTAGAQAFPMAGIGRLGHNPPRGPSADWRVLTTADATGTNGLTCLPKHGGTRDRKLWSPIQ
ncbi:hypothetical protein evm_000819 [Chilo suppressalis]|nr:hypothetical protein evm_000819 [Chilo suppressalis]